MACDPQTLVTDSKCLWASLSERQLLASWAYQVCTNPPVPVTVRITEEGATRVTEEGDTRVIE